MERDLHYLAQLETYNNGKPLKDAVFDIYGAMYALKYYAGKFKIAVITESWLNPYLLNQVGLIRSMVSQFQQVFTSWLLLNLHNTRSLFFNVHLAVPYNS
jgi:hypothetical protein